MNAEIRFELNGQEVTLPQLGALFQNDGASRALLRLADRIQERVGHLRCAVHHQFPRITVVVSSTQSGFRVGGCCQAHIDEVGEEIRSLVSQIARPNFGTRLVLTVEGSDRPFVFDADAIHELIIGRFDPDTGQSPDIDLHEYRGYENGVSRRHASIVWRNGALNLVDKGTPNGTYLNGYRIAANQPHILRDGDFIRVGRLVLRVSVEYAFARKTLLS